MGVRYVIVPMTAFPWDRGYIYVYIYMKDIERLICMENVYINIPTDPVSETLVFLKN